MTGAGETENQNSSDLKYNMGMAIKTISVIRSYLFSNLEIYPLLIASLDMIS